MSIKTKLTTGIVSVGDVQTTIIETEDRIGIEACNVYNADTITRTINFYISPDLDISSGKKVAEITLSPSEECDVNAIVGQGYSVGQNIIAILKLEEQVTNKTVDCSTTYTQFTGDDI